MHIADPETGNLGANAIVGGSAGLATGAALSAKMRKSGQVAVCFFGDGALGQGLSHEAMNMASLWKLRSSTCARTTSTASTPQAPRPSRRDPVAPRALGVHAESVDGRTCRRSTHHEAGWWSGRAAARAAFLECKTYRYYATTLAT